jgi:hypothetical protein
MLRTALPHRRLPKALLRHVARLRESTQWEGKAMLWAGVFSNLVPDVIPRPLGWAAAGRRVRS